MSANSRPDPRSARAALLWDESFLWGVMACRALQEAGLPFDVIRSENVRQGGLADYRALFVPGGWASNKTKALGEAGFDAIRRFVERGGAYVGFCGGAGLASRDGIGLLPVRRRPTSERVPSFSGRIRLSLADSPLWQGIAGPVFHAWWPSQFVADGEVDVLATYAEALPDSFSSDVNVGDAESLGGWGVLEERYGINLDPRRLSGEPAVIEGVCGNGRVLLSLVHFDTLDDRNGVMVLKNLWRIMGVDQATDEVRGAQQEPRPALSGASAERLDDLAAAVDDLIELGTRNFLWFPRHRPLLQWRRGVRGLEYCTLSVMVHELQLLLRERGWPAGGDAMTDRVRSAARAFLPGARELLLRERFALQQGPITYERCDDPRIQELREALFSRSKSHGGLFKDLVDGLDRMLVALLQEGCGR